MSESNGPNEPTSLGPVEREVLTRVASLWWAVLLRGVLLVVVGGYALVTPGVTLVAYTSVLAIFAVLDGVLAIVAAVAGWIESRWWAAARGIVAVLVGLFVLAHPVLVGVIAVTTLVVLLAIQSIAGGVLEVVTAVRERNAIQGEWWLIAGGVLSVVFGLILLGSPLIAGAVLIQVLGVFAVVAGIALTVASIRLRRLRHGA